LILCMPCTEAESDDKCMTARPLAYMQIQEGLWPIIEGIPF